MFAPLTSLRFFAALWILLVHLQLRGEFGEPWVLKRIIGAGAVGMTFFFTLSGFVLARAYAEADLASGLGGYFWRRLARIYPVFLLAWGMNLLLFGFTFDLGATPWRAKIAGVLADLTLTNAWFPQLFLDGHFHDGSWSLSAEAFFYALFPFAAIWAARAETVTLRRSIPWLFAAMAFFGMLGKYLPMQPAKLQTGIFYAMPIFRLPEFLAGVFAGVLSMRREHLPPSGRRLAWWGLGCIFFLFTAGKAFTAQVDAAIFGPFFLCLYSYLCANPEGRLAAVLSWRPLVFLGEASYALYLFQLILLAAYYDGLIPVCLSLPVDCFLACMAVAAVVHVLWERPLRRRIVAWADSR
jgi:peptidoglycan/LPS O-acetylase OafA/YrhL